MRYYYYDSLKVVLQYSGRPIVYCNALYGLRLHIMYFYASFITYTCPTRLHFVRRWYLINFFFFGPLWMYAITKQSPHRQHKSVHCFAAKGTFTSKEQCCRMHGAHFLPHAFSQHSACHTVCSMHSVRHKRLFGKKTRVGSFIYRLICSKVLKPSYSIDEWRPPPDEGFTAQVGHWRVSITAYPLDEHRDGLNTTWYSHCNSFECSTAGGHQPPASFASDWVAEGEWKEIDRTWIRRKPSDKYKHAFVSTDQIHF